MSGATNIWSFNLRSTKTSHDSDSDDSNDDSPSNSISEETRLLQDLDISHREESVVYKPNPFSIAKINAAARRTHAPVAPVVDRPAKAASKAPTGRIVESFKKAQQKKPPKPVTKSNAPGAGTILSPTVKAPIPHSTTTVSPSISRMDIDQRIPTATLQPTHIDALETPLSVHPDPTVVLPQAANEMPANISTASQLTSQKRTPAPGSSSATRKNHTATVHGPTTPMPNPRNMLRLTHEISAHISTTSPKKVVKKFRPPAPISFSSPLKASSVEQRGSGTAANSVFYSSPVRPQFASTSLDVPSIRPEHSRGKSIQASAMHTTAAYQSHSAHVPRPRPTGTSSNSTDAEFHSMLATISSSTSHPKSLRTASVASFVPLEPALILPNPRVPSPGVALAYPPSQSRDPCRQYDLNLPPSSPIRSPIPTPDPSPRRKRESAPKLLPPKKSHRPPKRPTSDVYDYFGSDPDDEWSTLPARKKTKVTEPARPGIKGIKTSGTFRLPGTTAQPKVTGMSATSARRVVTFLPPPLKAGKVEVLVEDSKPEVEVKVQSDPDAVPYLVPQHSRDSSPPQKTPKRRRLSANPYPSPANSRLTPGIAAMDATVSSGVQSSPIRALAHRFLSPPTSDPVPEHNSEMYVTVAVDGLSERYPQTKTLMRQRKRGADGVWNILELPSCGMVHVDDEDHSPGRELSVVVWPGQEVQV